jgi:hypothetical protein
MHLSDLGTLHSNEEVEVAVRECLQIEELDKHCDGILKLVPRRTDVSVCSGVVRNTYCGAVAELRLVVFSCDKRRLSCLSCFTYSDDSSAF